MADIDQEELREFLKTFLSIVHVYLFNPTIRQFFLKCCGVLYFAVNHVGYVFYCYESLSNENHCCFKT